MPTRRRTGASGAPTTRSAPELPRRRRRCCAGAQHIRTGDVFTLQIQMGRTDGPGDPLWPGRTRDASSTKVLDESTWDSDGAPQFPGGLHYADDTALMFLQGSTQYDALGHVWYDGQLWNGYDARTTIGGMDKASRAADRREGRRRPGRADRHGPPPRQGLAGQGRDVRPRRPRGRGRQRRASTIEPHDILCVRTGCHEVLVRAQRQGGSTTASTSRASRTAPSWSSGSSEHGDPQPRHRHHRQRGHLRAGSGVALPLHSALMRNLGVDAHRDRLARRPGRRLRRGRAVELPLRRGAAEGRRGHRRAGEPDRHPLMRRVSTTNGRGCTSTAPGQPTRHHAGVRRRAGHVPAGVARNPDGDAIRYFDGAHHLPRARRADRRVRGRAARRRLRARRPAWRCTCRTCPQFVIGLVGTWKAGGIVVSINPMNRERELDATC